MNVCPAEHRAAEGAGPGRRDTPEPEDQKMTESEWMEHFENGTLSNGVFHHAEHVKMAFLYVQRYPPLDALSRFSAALARFAATHGKPELYNETITWAFFLLIRERLARAGGRQTWAEFSALNADLSSWKDNLLTKYYRPETLTSELAKRVFLFPDKLQLVSPGNSTNSRK